MDKIAIQWTFKQPSLGPFTERKQPVDIELLSLSRRPLSIHALEPIRRRAILYSKAGCPKDGCVKAALRDYYQQKDNSI